MQGDEIAVLMGYLDLCEYYRNMNPSNIQEEFRPHFNIFKTIEESVEHLVLCAIDLINLYQAYRFNDQTQNPGLYRSTIHRHICIHIDDFNKRLNTQILGRDFNNNLERISEVFRDRASLEVPSAFRECLREYNRYMEPRRGYFEDIRNNVAAHINTDIDCLISILNTVDEERIREVFYYILEFMLKFIRVDRPLKEEFIESTSDNN